MLISGGDGLTLAPKLFESVLRGLREIPHVEIIRIGSRVPVFLPQRIDEELCEMLAKYHPVWLNIHVNHPNEITPELARACDMLARAGVPLGNQSVLLAGVNDCVHIQRDLVQRLVEIRVRPYYIYQCDLVEGAGHFRTPVGKGLEIMEGLRGHTSGYAVPPVHRRCARRRREDPGHAELPRLVLGPQGRAPQLRGVHHHVRGAHDVHAARQGDLPVVSAPAPRAGAGGDHGAARREADVDRAAGFVETHARGNEEAHRLQDPSKWVPYGVGALEGQAGQPLPVLQATTGRGTADPAAGYGPGEEPRPADGMPTATANHELL